MPTYGIICECNPFHEGHRYIIDCAYSLGAEAVVSVMSGDFVQRGEPALVSKFVRARDMADNGCSLVLELPVRYALSSAQEFARAGVKLLAATGTVDVLLFGSECGDIKALERAAELVSDDSVMERIDMLAQTGLSWPAAREQVLLGMGEEETARILGSANNILAVEYIRAVKEFAPSMECRTVLRKEGTSTAHGVRDAFFRGEDITGTVSETTLGILHDGKYPLYSAWDRIALLKLREMIAQEYSVLADTAGGLDSRMYAASRVACSYDDLLDNVKTKRYTMSRIKRVAVRGMLGITYDGGSAPYLRILAIGKGGRKVLASMKGSAVLPVSESLKVLMSQNRECERTALEEIRATDLYNTILKVPSPMSEDFTGRLYVNDDN